MADVNDRTATDSECATCAAFSRRDFIKTIGAGALAASVPIIGRTAAAAGTAKVGPTPSAPAETAVARFYKTITPEQRKVICFPFDHHLRSKVGNNWAIVKPEISEFSPEQQALCQEIMKNL